MKCTIQFTKYLQLVAPPLNCRHEAATATATTIRAERKKLQKLKRNGTKQKAAVISNHNNCRERRNKNQEKRCKRVN